MAKNENATRNRQKQANQDSKMMRPMGKEAKPQMMLEKKSKKAEKQRN